MATGDGQGGRNANTGGQTGGGEPTGGTNARDAGDSNHDAEARVSCPGLGVPDTVTWPDLWLNNCTIPLQRVPCDSNPDYLAIAVNCSWMPQLRFDSGPGAWSYDAATNTITLTSELCNVVSAAGVAQLDLVSAGSISCDPINATILVHFDIANAG